MRLPPCDPRPKRGPLTFYYLVIDSFFTRQDQIEDVFAALEPLWPWFDALVSVQHVQNPVLCIAEVTRVKELGRQEMHANTSAFVGWVTVTVSGGGNASLVGCRHF